MTARAAFAARLHAGRLVLDGGIGTGLIARGLPPGTPPEVWNLERREDVLAVHRAHVGAGSEAVHTNTFGANVARLARFGLAEAYREINRLGVEIARDSGARWVIGDVGPTGDYLPPVGHADPAAWRDAFARQASVLAEAGVDAIHVETISDFREAAAALEAIRDTLPEIPVIVSMTFDRKKRGFFTIMGDRPVESLRQLLDGGALAAGINCSLTSADAAELARTCRAEIPRAALVVQPNAPAGGAGEADPAPIAALAREGVALAVGGCCGTAATFIGSLASAVRAPGPPGAPA